MLAAPIEKISTEEIPVFNRDFDQFLSYLNGGNRRPLISPKTFADVLSMDLQSLAAAARVHRNTVTRAPESESVQNYLRESVRVIRAATDIGVSVEKALYWFKNDPIPTFDYKTANQIVIDGRAEDLIRYLQSLQAGFAG